MSKKRLSILGLSYSQTQSGAYALVLAEEEGNRRVPIIIGGAEAQSIAIQLEGLKPVRPLTHDLFVNFAKSFNINLVEVNIFKLEEGIFYSELVCDNGLDIIRIDARTSDAIALALRFQCPIFTTDDILQRAGIVIEFDDKSRTMDDISDGLDSSNLGRYSDADLEEMLTDAIKEENYELASEIRDEIKQRKTQDES